MNAILSLLTITMALSADAANEPAWVKVGTEQGVTISRKEIPGSPLFAYKAEGVLDAPLSKLLTVVRDVKRQKEWVNRLDEARVLGEKSPMHRVVYTRISTPWPLKDRDFVFESVITLNAKAKSATIDVKSVENPGAPESDCCIRGQITFNRVVLKALGGGRTEVMAEAHVDPRGAIPAWVVNRVQKTFPNKTLTGLLAQTRKPDIAEASEVKGWEPSASAEELDAGTAFGRADPAAFVTAVLAGPAGR